MAAAHETSIFITNDVIKIGELTYDYRDGVYKNVYTNNYLIIWHGQKTGRDDHLVSNGTHVFIRSKNNKPYSYLGIIKNSKVLHYRNENALYQLQFEISAGILPCETVCDICTTEGSGKWQRAAWNATGLPYPNGSHCKGIYKH